MQMALDAVANGDSTVGNRGLTILLLQVVDTMTMMILEASEVLVKKLRKPYPGVRKLVDDRRRLHAKYS